MVQQPRNPWCGQSNHGPTAEWNNHGARPQIAEKKKGSSFYTTRHYYQHYYYYYYYYYP